MTDRDLLLDIQARLIRLELAVGRLAPEPKIIRQDRRALAVLLPALYAIYAETPFKACDALSVATPLGLAATAKGLGRLFGRARGVFIGAFRIEDVAREGNTRLWAIRTLGLSGHQSHLKAA